MPNEPSKLQALEDAVGGSLKRHPEQLAEVSGWLGRLVLLYGVPLHYLVPDPAMLPKETIRLFFLDPNWIQALLQGACSVGNTRYGDHLIDQAMNQWIQAAVDPKKTGTASPEAAPAARAAAGERERLREQYEGVRPQSGDGTVPSERDLNWPLTGFLLRSAVVDGWRGLEIEARGRDRNRLDALRIEQLAGDVLLGLFNGGIGSLVIRQPREGLHFGLTADTGGAPGSYSKTLRDPGTGRLLQDKTIDLHGAGLMRDQPEGGVVDIAGLAGRMQQLLPDVHFGSGAFGLQLIEAAGEFTFEPDQ